ncbi:MAG: ABC transporter ATP-binding protein [Planctomycetaceae bacterium]
MTDQPAIQANGLHKSYRTGGVQIPVLTGIDLTVTHGECLFLVGPSGSGKTTLLSILGCVLSSDAGTLEILGQDVSRLSSTAQARFRRERIGFVFQRFHLFDGLRVWENVRIVFDLLGRSHVEGKRVALDLLERVGLKDRTHHRVNQLSMGQRQRVAIARALAANPDLILADEPTASLDAESGQNAMSILKELCRELQKTVVVVTHDSRIFPLADRILSLDAGRIAHESKSTGNSRETPQASSPVTISNPNPLAAVV